MGRVHEHLKNIPTGGMSMQKCGGGICKEAGGEQGGADYGKPRPQDANSLGSKPEAIMGEQRGPVNL